MAYVSVNGAEGAITTPLPAVGNSAVVTLSTALASFLQSRLSAGDWTYMGIGEGDALEVVKLYYSASSQFSIDRAQDGTYLNAHPASSLAKYLFVLEAVQDITPTESATVIAEFPITVSNPIAGQFSVGLQAPNFINGDGLSISGSWQDGYTFELVPSDIGCTGCGNAGTGGSGTTVAVLAGGVAEVNEVGSTFTVTVQEPNFASSDNSVYISGLWPNYDIVARGVGSSGVSTVSGGTGISVTGNPGVSPVINIAATGVVAGGYGGIQVNAQGQLTSVDAGFAPPSSIAATLPLVAERTGNAVAFSVGAASEGTAGVVALADADNPMDGADRATAVTPALLAAVVASLAGAEVAGGQTYTGEADSAYSNILSAPAVSLNLAAGESALVHAEVTIVDSVTPASVVQYGLAVFNTSQLRLQSNRSVSQNQQSMTFLITGPVAYGLALVTTTLPSNSVVASTSLTAIVF